MPTPQKDIVNLDLCQYYHCISRCLRRAFLCEQDEKTGRSFDHRKEWLVNLMHKLTQLFAIRICAYAVMSNHYHLVLFVDTEEALKWSDQEIVMRWASLFPMSKAQIYLEEGTGHLVSRPRGFHPQPLPEPDVTLSRHPAPTILPLVFRNTANTH